MSKKIIHTLVFATGIVLPFILIILYPDLYNKYDFSVMKSWANFSASIFDVYLTTCRCEYPALGLMLSTIPIKIVGGDPVFFRLYLALYDVAIIIVFYYLLRALSVKNPLLWAGLLGIVPSSWAGTSLWGQIDNIGQLFVLAAFFMVYLIFTYKKITLKYYLYCIIAGVFASCMLMTKQLLVFPFAALSVVVSIVILIRDDSVKQKIVAFLSLFVGLFVSVLCVDALFEFDAHFISHLHRILDVYGSERHLHEISANGFNIWMSLGSDFVDARQAFWQNVTPKTGGFVLFAVYSISIAAFTTYKLFVHKVHFSKTHMFACLLCFFALFNLAFNVLLTGTHERYLLYFYPYIILASLLLKHNATLYISLGMAIVYGVFVLIILNRDYELIIHYITGALHLAFFVYLTVLLFMQLSFSKHAK
ncbi:MAG: hypothetical protein PF481_10020 [Bacteroidales bacterium]|jgi:hypothetical protein|nr:hypothetical protein [Bacteroidales bacterium]